MILPQLRHSLLEKGLRATPLMPGLMDPGLADGASLGHAPFLRSPLLGLSTAGEAAAGLPFGLEIDTLQTSVLLYLGLSSLAFVVVWVVGYVRSR